MSSSDPRARGTARPTSVVGVRAGGSASAAAAEARPERQERPDKAPTRLRIISPRVRRRRAGAVLTLATVSVFAVMVGMVVLQTKMAQEQERLDKIQQQTKLAQQAYDHLRVVVAAMESPAAITASAARLGMVPPAQVTYLTPTAADRAEVTAALAAIGALGSAGATHGGTPASGASSDLSPGSGWTTVKPLVEGGP